MALRTLLLGKKRGWLTLWGLLVTLGILSTPAAAPGSIEGMLYSRLPMWYHLIGYPEIMLPDGCVVNEVISNDPLMNGYILKLGRQVTTGSTEYIRMTFRRATRTPGLSFR